MAPLDFRRIVRPRLSPILYGIRSWVEAARHGLSEMPFLMGEQLECKSLKRRLNLTIPRVDLDIEGGTSTGYAAFVNQIRSHASDASKKSEILAYMDELTANRAQ